LEDDKGNDILDVIPGLVAVLEGLSDVSATLRGSSFMNAYGVSFSDVDDNLKTVLTEAKEFTTLCSAWDLMLASEETTSQQKKTDLDHFLTAAKVSFPDFPQSLSSLLQKWRQGLDVSSALP